MILLFHTFHIFISYLLERYVFRYEENDLVLLPAVRDGSIDCRDSIDGNSRTEKRQKQEVNLENKPTLSGLPSRIAEQHPMDFSHASPIVCVTDDLSTFHDDDKTPQTEQLPEINNYESSELGKGAVQTKESSMTDDIEVTAWKEEIIEPAIEIQLNLESKLGRTYPDDDSESFISCSESPPSVTLDAYETGLENETDYNSDASTEIFNTNLDETSTTITADDSEPCTKKDDKVGIKFFPALFIQRYHAVYEVLKAYQEKEDIRKVVDFGCSEFKFLQYVKDLHNVQEIALVDIDKDVIQKYLHRTNPMHSDYIYRRPEPLKVSIYHGSIAVKDHRLLGFDAVTGIELIEHLMPDVLEKLPEIVFGFIEPKIAVFTTPNSEFNVLFPGFTGFRHDDHKFEWTRAEFQNWCASIVSSYPNYSVRYDGIGTGPMGASEVYGCCSQMAVFTWNSLTPCSSSSQMDISSSTSQCNVRLRAGGVIDEKGSPQEHHNEMPYILMDEIQFPYNMDTRTLEEKVHDQTMLTLRNMYVNAQKSVEDSQDYLSSLDGYIAVPLLKLLSFQELSELCHCATQYRNILKSFDMEICEENNTLCVVYRDEEYYSDSSSDTISVHEEEIELDFPNPQQRSPDHPIDSWNFSFDGACGDGHHNVDTW